MKVDWGFPKDLVTREQYRCGSNYDYVVVWRMRKDGEWRARRYANSGKINGYYTLPDPERTITAEQAQAWALACIRLDAVPISD